MCTAWPAGGWIHTSRCRRLNFPLPHRRTPTCTTRCSLGRCTLARRTPRCALTPLTWPCRCAADLDQMLRRALPLMVLPYRRDRLLALRVRQLLRQRPSHTATTLAADLALSPRSLHRQLTTEGTSLQTLKDETRREQACALLLRTQQPIRHVAHAAGFRNDKSFIRAFRQWTGLTPGEYRARQKAK